MPRTLIVGDVHGCLDELRDLLDRVAWSEGDRLLCVGDVISRGPDSCGVLQQLRRLAGQSVVGNHEERLIAVRQARRSGERGPRLGPRQAQLFTELQPEDWKQLESFPLMLTLESHDLVIVHAGVVPTLPLSAQDPWVLTHVRTIQPDGSPSSGRGATLWGELYEGASHIVFGHNAVDGLQLHAAATGLDTGCVYGGSLTALVLQAGQTVPPASERQDVLVSVPARKAYVDFR